MTEPQQPFAGPPSVTEGDSSPKGRVERLEAIIARLTALTEPSREVDRAIHASLGFRPRRQETAAPFVNVADQWHPPHGGGILHGTPEYTASLDAILSHLMPEGWALSSIARQPDHFDIPESERYYAVYCRKDESKYVNGMASTECIARLIACIRARMEDE